MQLHRWLAALHIVLAVLAVASAQVALPGCASPPTVAEKINYDPPRWQPLTDLEEKAERHERQTLAMIDEAGWLMYRVAQPWTEPLVEDELYRRSHNLADVPAWHGYLMAALAWKMAVLHRDEPDGRGGSDSSEMQTLDAELRRLADAYHFTYRVTGAPGLLARSVLPGYTGEQPLKWMETEAAESPWRRSPHTGEWFRDGMNKDHYNLAAFGLAIPLALDRRGEIALSTDTREVLIAALVPLVRRLVENEYILRDSLGERSPYSNLGPNSGLILPNGFHRMISLHALASAAPYDEPLRDEYEKRLGQWTDGLEFSMDLSGAWSKARGRWNRAANISDSDAQAFALAACSLLLQEDRDPHRARAQNALHGWWNFMQYELNAPFTLTYAAYVENDPQQRRAAAAGIEAELRDFPPEKYVPNGRDVESKLEVTPGELQPIHNRPIDSNYWKASAYERVTETERQTENRYAGMDYLLAYWMGRYFDLLPAR